MSPDLPRLRVGLIGSGFMGKAHAFGYAAAPRVFDLPMRIELATLADATPQIAARAARTLGFASSTADWRDLLADPTIDLIDITAPNALHHEMAMAAIAAGKHVYCEKPLAPALAQAREMTKAATQAGVMTQVGFNYICNPMMALAREMIAAGELGQIRSYRGIHAEDYMADATAPFSFRNDPVGGGVLADLGSHALATAEYLLGRITGVMGDLATAIPSRPDPTGGERAVETDDVARAFLRFENGASGSIEANWIATGRKMQHDFEVHGSRGALVFTGERLNEMHFYSADDPAGRRGFRRIEAAPDHPPYGNFCVAPGHQIGFNDLKTIEIARFVTAIADRSVEPFGFSAGLRIQTLIETIRISAETDAWCSVP
jgi:predicted dehydrogenase